jgi:hypothetical protein
VSERILWTCPFCGVLQMPREGAADKVNDGNFHYAESERAYRCPQGHEFTVSIMVTGVAQPELELAKTAV